MYLILQWGTGLRFHSVRIIKFWHFLWSYCDANEAYANLSPWIQPVFTISLLGGLVIFFLINLELYVKIIYIKSYITFIHFRKVIRKPFLKSILRHVRDLWHQYGGVATMTSKLWFTSKNMAEKRQKTYHFNSAWEVEFFFTSVKEKCVCLICGTTDCCYSKAAQCGETLQYFFKHELHQEQTQNKTHWSTFTRHNQACSVKLFTRL